MRYFPFPLETQGLRFLIGLLGLASTSMDLHAQGSGQVQFESANYSVNEQASYRTVHVLRSGGSSGSITVPYATSDGTATVADGDYVATTGSLVFADGETQKAISIQVANAGVDVANETFQLTLSGAPGVLGATVSTTITINDTPTITGIVAQTTSIGTSTSAIPFTVGDAETPAGDITLSATSSNPQLIPVGNIVFGGSGAARTVTVTPAASLSGTSRIYIIGKDANGAEITNNFNLQVGNATAGTAIAISSSTPANSLPNVVLGADDLFNLNYTVTSSAWVTNVTFVEIDNANLINSHGTGSTNDLRTQSTSGGTARTLRNRANDRSTAIGEYGTANITLSFTGSGAPTNTHTYGLRVNPRAQADNNLLGIPGTTSTFDVLANDARPLPGHTFNITGVAGANNGTLAIAPDGKTLRYTPSNLITGIDRFSYTVTVSSSDAFNGYTFTGQAYVKIGGYAVVDSPTSAQHIDLDFDFVAGQEWIQRIRTDATINGSVESGTYGPSIHDSDEGVIFFDPSTKITRSASSNMDPLGVPAGADVWYGPTSGSANKVFLGIASESTSGIESYTPVGDPRAVSNALWVRTDLVAFSGPGHFAAFNGSSLAMDTFDGVNPTTGSEATSGDNSNVSDTFWGFSGSHAHPAWYFTAPGRYELTFRSTVRVAGVFFTSPNTVFTFDVDTMSGNVRLRENPPTLKNDAITIIEDSAATSINVLANDSSNPDGFERMAINATSANGSVTIAGDGLSLNYTPALNFAGTDSFTYTVTDEHGGTATASVLVTVTGENDAPTFSGYSVSTAYQTAATISFGKLLSKTSDPEGDAVSVSAAGPASAQGGTTALQVGSILYTPPVGFSGADTFSVTFADAHGAPVVGTVTVQVGPDPHGGGQGTNTPQLTMLPGGDIAISFQGIPGRTYQIQRSINLSAWTDLTTVVAAANGAVTYTDEDPPRPSAFYRLRRQ